MLAIQVGRDWQSSSQPACLAQVIDCTLHIADLKVEIACSFKVAEYQNPVDYSLHSKSVLVYNVLRLRCCGT
jgi:hypothetical protein